MGKRKNEKVSSSSSTSSSGQGKDQCDVWLTAKPPAKQRVLRREPLSILRIFNEPIFTASTATKQTTLSDFFKKPRKSETEHQKHNPHGLKSTGKDTDSKFTAEKRKLTSPEIDPVDRKYTVNVSGDSSPRRKTLKRTTNELDKASLAPQDENVFKYDVRDENVNNLGLDAGLKSESHITCSVPNHSVISKRECRGKNQQRQDKDTSPDLSYFDDSPTIKELDTQLPYPSSSQVVMNPSQRLCSRPMTELPNLGPDRGAESSDPATKRSSSDSLWKARSASARERPSEEDQGLRSQECSATDTQSSMDLRRLKYIDPVLLDTAPMPLSQTEYDTDKEERSLLWSGKCPELESKSLDYQPGLLKFVDPDDLVLQASTMEMSTELSEGLSGGDLTLDQSLPGESWDFTVVSQIGPVLKRSSIDTGSYMDDEHDHDSQICD